MRTTLDLDLDVLRAAKMLLALATKLAGGSPRLIVRSR